MSKAKRLLFREAIRHAVASAAAGVVTAVIIFLGLLSGALNDEPALTSLIVTLFFGLYGPIFLLLSWLIFRDLEGGHLRSQLTSTVEHSRLLRWLLLSSPASWASTVLFSSADVALTRRSIRGLASLHSVLAFAYSTAIIAVFASLLITLTA